MLFLCRKVIRWGDGDVRFCRLWHMYTGHASETSLTEHEDFLPGDITTQRSPLILVRRKGTWPELILGGRCLE